MVKFGRHLQSVCFHEWKEFYVDYTKLRWLAVLGSDFVGDANVMNRNASASVTSAGGLSADSESIDSLVGSNLLSDLGESDVRQVFVEHWRKEHKKALAFYLEKSTSIFRAFSEMHGDDALAQLASDRRKSLDINMNLKGKRGELHEISFLAREALSFAQLNSEALRKAAKKFDKNSAKREQSEFSSKNSAASVLLPELLASAICQSNLYLETLSRPAGLSQQKHCAAKKTETEDFSVNGDLHDGRGVNGRSGPKTASNHRTSNDSNNDTTNGPPSPGPLHAARALVRRIDRNTHASLVFHRGLHSPTNDPLARPIENTLQAYEQAWLAGARYCECDVTITEDGWIVLLHDDTLKRLALDPLASVANKPITRMRYDEVSTVPLLSGACAPLLSSVLEAAKRISSGRSDRASNPCGLVIEIKPGAGSLRTARELSSLLTRDRPDLLPFVSVVMSFDLYVAQQFARQFKQKLSIFCGAQSSAQDASSRSGSLLFEMDGPAESSPDDGSVQIDQSESAGWHSPVPKIMLLTHTKARIEAYRAKLRSEGKIVPKQYATRLYLDFSNPKEASKMVSKWMNQGSSAALDGIYCEYDADLFAATTTGSISLDVFRTLSRSLTMGVWLNAGLGDADSITVARNCVAAGARFVNTDLPLTFLDEDVDAGDIH